MALISKNKVSFVNGTILTPDTTDPRFPVWERCNTMVLSWLHRSITSSISQSILWMDKAYDVWRDLKERFSQSDIFRISDIQDDIYRLHQGDSSISDYFTRLKILWDELEALQPTPTCKCVRPCCSIAVEVKNSKERDYSIRFLKGLNDQFSHVRSQIMLMDPLPSVNRVFSLVAQQERQLQIESSGPIHHDNSRIFFNSAEQVPERGRGQTRGRGRGFNPARGRGSRLCTYCGKTSHTVETCFEKHGYPPGFKQRNPMHKINAVVSEEFNQVDNSREADTKENFTKSQYHTIMEMIQQTMKVQHALPPSSPHVSNMVHTNVLNVDSQSSEASKSSNQWVLDTGATDHITFNSANLSSIKYIEPIAISLPNGTRVYSNMSCTVDISKTLTLTDVLYVREFGVNLISVHKLISETDCHVTFQLRDCLI
ncbi:uncharacterized protein LOC133285922 [Gastrolobium bilobum]|uniref:uncharacterized protein LOC133285922 n=1 Tax=Gastrolobium bilobum TaxID=150636 RepID=UPI002AB2BC68|nr:uncharacterized protein LOC133285922 [Gastrolobium bilobum]